MTLWLLRHAQPLIEAGTCYGATDVAADVQATLLAAQAMAQVVPKGVAMLSSPLQRCEQLSQSICRLRPDLTYKTDQRLVEMDFGVWEGQRWDAIPQAAYDHWTAEFGQHRFGGAQSVSEFMATVALVWDETHHAQRDAIWVTHAGVIRAANLLALGVRQIDTAAQWPQAAPGWGCWQTIAIKPPQPGCAPGLWPGTGPGLHGP